MSGRDLLRRVRDLGIEIDLDGSDLVIRPRSEVPTDLLNELRAEKAAVVAALRGEPPVEGILLDGGRRWTPPPERPGYCPCDEMRVWDLQSGLCRTCNVAVFGPKIPARGTRRER